jgi:hypothetical protein
LVTDLDAAVFCCVFSTVSIEQAHTAMKVPDDSFNIVVMGAMNPRIHSPAWYHYNKMISQEEMEQAVKSPKTMALLPISHVDLTNFAITCHEDKWIIETATLQMFGRLKEITISVFDELLKHTPTSAMGFNFRYHRTTDNENVGERLAVMLSEAGFGIAISEPLFGELQVRSRLGKTALHVQLQALQSKELSNVLSILHNYEYSYFDKGGFFELGEDIRGNFEANWQDSKARTALILNAFNTKTG